MGYGQAYGQPLQNTILTALGVMVMAFSAKQWAIQNATLLSLLIILSEKW